MHIIGIIYKKHTFMPYQVEIPDNLREAQKLTGFIIGAYIGYYSYEDLANTLLCGAIGYGYGYLNLLNRVPNGVTIGALLGKTASPYGALIGSALGYVTDQFDEYPELSKNCTINTEMACAIAFRLGFSGYDVLLAAMLGVLSSQQRIADISTGCLSGVLACSGLGLWGMVGGATIGLLSTWRPELFPALFALSVGAQYGLAATALITCISFVADRYENGNFLLHEIYAFKNQFLLSQDLMLSIPNVAVQFYKNSDKWDKAIKSIEDSTFKYKDELLEKLRSFPNMLSF
jgi:hypothetical protein